MRKFLLCLMTMYIQSMSVQGNEKLLEERFSYNISQQDEGKDFPTGDKVDDVSKSSESEGETVALTAKGRTGFFSRWNLSKTIKSMFFGSLLFTAAIVGAVEPASLVPSTALRPKEFCTQFLDGSGTLPYNPEWGCFDSALESSISNTGSSQPHTDSSAWFEGQSIINALDLEITAINATESNTTESNATEWTGHLTSFPTSSKSTKSSARRTNVFTPDDRQVAPFAYPASAYGRLDFTFDGKSGACCTATLVSPTHILTNAHCVGKPQHSNAQTTFVVPPIWKQMAVFHPALRDGSSISGDDASIVSYTLADTPDYGTNDWAILELDRPLGKKYGWIGVLGRGPRDYKDNENVSLSTYSADHYSMSPSIQKDCQFLMPSVFQDSDFQVEHNCDTTPGSSGSAMYQYFLINGALLPRIVALNHAHFPYPGSAPGTYLTPIEVERRYSNLAVPTRAIANWLVAHGFNDSSIPEELPKNHSNFNMDIIVGLSIGVGCIVVACIFYQCATKNKPNLTRVIAIHPRAAVLNEAAPVETEETVEIVESMEEGRVAHAI